MFWDFMAELLASAFFKVLLDHMDQDAVYDLRRIEAMQQQLSVVTGQHLLFEELATLVGNFLGDDIRKKVAHSGDGQSLLDGSWAKIPHFVLKVVCA